MVQKVINQDDLDAARDIDEAECKVIQAAIDLHLCKRDNWATSWTRDKNGELVSRQDTEFADAVEELLKVRNE